LKNPNYFLWQQPLPVFGWGSYGGLLKRVIAVMKYENQPEIGRVLGTPLGVAWFLNTPQLNKKPVVIVILLHTKKLKERGYNQATLIAEGSCQRTG
jgi:predicted amidophosphoribosyltransferase